ncbi:uncharacterized protein LOC143144388 isoform X2 [Ptiloglossa arizonensis]|uniref:uncharacterized protein LOC143144388 isoform X2 n=1 Tax=Ptiloglossa arizonensis TaxID=3350558 RepID=UPI003FA030F1
MSSVIYTSLRGTIKKKGETTDDEYASIALRYLLSPYKRNHSVDVRFKDIADTVNMTRFIIFAALLAVQFGGGISEISEIIGIESEPLILPLEESLLDFIDRFDKLIWCELETNYGEKYLSSFFQFMEKDSIIKKEESCTFTVNFMSKMDTGNWTITVAALNTSTSQTYTVYLKQEAMLTANNIDVLEDFYIYTELDVEMHNVSSCLIIAPNKTEIDLLTVDREDFHRFGECGVGASMRTNYSGTWTLIASGENEVLIKYYGSLRINVLSESPSSEMEIIYLERDKPAVLEPRIGNKPVDYCEIEDPSGVWFQSNTGQCSLSISSVSTRHDGVWIARYTGRSTFNLTHAFFKVVTYDLKSVDCNVLLAKNGEILLLCHTYALMNDYGRRENPSCRFTTPSGQILNLSPGIGSRYYRTVEFFINTTDSILYCGLAIVSPRPDDVGTWKLDIEYNDDYYSSVRKKIATTIHVDLNLQNGTEVQISEPIDTIIDAENVYVKLNDSYKINCNGHVPLSYCWFRNPNGTTYSVSRAKSRKPFSLSYVGSGLHTGECGAMINNSKYTDQGLWTCNLGIVNGTEERKQFTVKIVDSYFIAEPATHLMRTNQVNLTCKILPNLTDKRFRYCRWVRPDGYGIYNYKNYRYQTRNTDTECKLIISMETTDIGAWKCVGGLLENEEEIEATVTV